MVDSAKAPSPKSEDPTAFTENETVLFENYKARLQDLGYLLWAPARLRLPFIGQYAPLTIRYKSKGRVKGTPVAMTFEQVNEFIARRELAAKVRT